MTIEELKKKLDEAHYIYDDTLVTTLAVALKLGRPLLIEGAAGVGKTEVAKVMAYALGRDLVRLQCYEGLDESKAIYEWNYQKQLLSIQVDQSLAKVAGTDSKAESAALTKSLFSEDYLLERPLLKSIRSEKPVVLLIDEHVVRKESMEFDVLESDGCLKLRKHFLDVGIKQLLGSSNRGEGLEGVAEWGDDVSDVEVLPHQRLCWSGFGGVGSKRFAFFRGLFQVFGEDREMTFVFAVHLPLDGILNSFVSLGERFPVCAWQFPVFLFEHVNERARVGESVG